jgi:hypothetical protein
MWQNGKIRFWQSWIKPIRSYGGVKAERNKKFNAIRHHFGKEII